jgi:hypothetical protein
MTRRGASQVPWTTSDIKLLSDGAGKIPVLEICRQVKRTRTAVCKMASRLGLSLRVHEASLVWCVSCATWRTALDKDGLCGVCHKRRLLPGLYDTNADERSRLTEAQRRRLEEDEAEREEREALLQVKRESDRVKQSTKHLREKTGRNPRKRKGVVVEKK